jgi:hypothetical protein
MTPPMTTETDVERLRINPKRAVAVAMSSLLTRNLRAVSNGWKTRPTPRPATISTAMVSASDESTPKPDEKTKAQRRDCHSDPGQIKISASAVNKSLSCNANGGLNDSN